MATSILKMRIMACEIIPWLQQPGIIPVELNVSAKWVVCGIQPKSGCKDILEAEKLSFLWENWLKNSGTIQSPSLIVNTSGEKVRALVSKFL